MNKMPNKDSNTASPPSGGFRGYIKVCGITLPSQLEALDEIGVDLAGFIFYPKSPRYMVNKIPAEYLRKFRGKVAKVGVFVNMPYDELMRTVEDYRLDMVQLHGDEIPRYCEQVANYITVVKAFRLSENDPIDWMAKPYDEACDMYMFDTLGAGYGGTGKKFDWSVLKNSVINKLFFLSGGIEPGDEEKLREFAKEEIAKKIFAVDINSKFEISPGVKDIDKVKTFVENLKS
ncbi:MAG TPA: phosphoribosylanthranilate isomerase [Chitinophagaceae bacterium]|jgi:phosphoribosylanthranilate isomerase|nr:phosphoribosylanthranilate isomerase [Chitinophagaceae bacterium]